MLPQNYDPYTNSGKLKNSPYQNQRKYKNDPYNPDNVPQQPPPRRNDRPPSYMDPYGDPKMNNELQNYGASPYLGPPEINMPRNRSHSRDPPPNPNYQNSYNNQPMANIERSHSFDPLYYKDPFPQQQSTNPYNNRPRPPYQDYEHQGSGEPPLYYEYEKKASENFKNIHSNSFGMDYRPNDFNYPPDNMNRGDPRNPRDNLGMNYDDRREFNMMPNEHPLNRSRDRFKSYPETGFEKLFFANTLTMKPLFNQRRSNEDLDVFYNIYPGEVARDARSVVEPPLFTYTYKYGFCSKFCLTADCRAIDIIIRHPESGKEFLHLTRDCNCTFLCSHRPAMNVKYIEEGANGFNIGSIYNPFVCCDYELHISLENGAPRYFINSDCCSCNLYCCFNCDSCNKSTLSICDNNYTPMSKIQLLTSYEFCRPYVNGNDHYVLNFPPYATKDDRALLLASLVFIDCRYMANSIPT